MKYAALLLLTLPAVAGAKTPAPAAAVTTGPKVGATVVGKDNQNAGVISEVTDQAVVIDTGTNKVAVPLAAVGANPKGLWIGMTKAELDAAFVQAAQQAAQAAQQAKVNFLAQLTAGQPVNGLDGAALGTIKSKDADSVTLTTAKGNVRLPITAFGPGANGTIIVGATQEQVDAALGGSSTPKQ